jgi:putative ABC transport system substrate-binding protein
MRRREFITLLGGAAVTWPVVGLAQQVEHAKRVGVLAGLSTGADSELQARIAALKQTLRDLGWIENRNIIFDIRFAEGKPELLPSLAAELVRTPSDVIVASGSPATEAARGATKTIPIVMVAVGDALAAGFVTNLAHPGGNITGQTHVATEQGAKRLEIAKELFPNAGRVGVLWNGNNTGHSFQFREIQRVAPALGIELISMPVRGATELDPALRALVKAGSPALLSMDDGLISFLRVQTIEFCLRNKLALIGEFRLTPAAGGLISYGPIQVELWRLISSHVDKILRGANPGDLPVHQPTKFELVINLKTAKALGITVPPALLARTDEVIE